ncbi:MAG TPA: O-antigen ligase family protein [Nocardioides sp.]|nr:O-antigen ligase family protein [Nocardioides sp.]
MESRLVTVVAVVAAAVLGAAVTLGTTVAAAVAVLALGVCALAVLGPRRLGVVAVGGAFATAPMYRGIGSIGPATPTDLMLLLGLLLLTPVAFRRRIAMPGGFVLAVMLLAVVGLVCSATNDSPLTAVVYLLQWLLVAAAFPVFLLMWSPPRSVIDGLLACYVAGQLASIAKALVSGANAFTGRYQGFSHHPNDFGLAGAAAVAILLYLLPRCRSLTAQLAVLGLVAINLYSVVIMSGSRGATLAVAAVIVLIPIAERSGLWVLSMTFAGAIGLALLPFVLKAGGSGSSLSRLAGDKSSQGSDSERTAALSDGWHKFLHSPFVGTGLDPTVGIYHNLYLESAIAFGIFGLVAYLAYLFVFARPMFTTHPLRRLSYLTWLFLVVGVTFPGLNDRTISIPMAVAILATVPGNRAESDAPEGVEAAAR